MDKSVVKRLVSDAYIPRMVPVKQNFPRPRVSDVPARVRELIECEKIKGTIKPGMEIAITCGSRGIANIKL